MKAAGFRRKLASYEAVMVLTECSSNVTGESQDIELARISQRVCRIVWNRVQRLASISKEAGRHRSAGTPATPNGRGLSFSIGNRSGVRAHLLAAAIRGKFGPFRLDHVAHFIADRGEALQPFEALSKLSKVVLCKPPVVDPVCLFRSAISMRRWCWRSVASSLVV